MTATDCVDAAGNAWPEHDFYNDIECRHCGAEAAETCEHCGGSGADPDDPGEWNSDVRAHDPAGRRDCPECDGEGTR